MEFTFELYLISQYLEISFCLQYLRQSSIEMSFNFFMSKAKITHISTLTTFHHEEKNDRH